VSWSWGGFFDVANREAKIANDKQLSLSPGFWDDNARATSILKEIKLNEYWIGLYHAVNTAVEDFAVLFEFWKAGMQLRKKQKLLSTMPSIKLKKPNSKARLMSRKMNCLL